MKTKRHFALLAWPAMGVLLMGLLVASCKDGKTAKEAEANVEEAEELDEEDMADNPDAYFQDVKTVKVKTALEFLSALKSNRHIIITESDDLDLTDAINTMANNDEMDSYSWGDGSVRTNAGVFYNEEFDGNTIVISKLHDVFIEGQGTEGADLRVVPRYADVLRFENCRNIAIRNVTMGHYAAGSCSGDVLVLKKTKNVLVDDCRIFGCGVNGLNTSYATDVKVKNSNIYGCSDRGIVMEGSRNISFEKCKVYDNDFGALYADEGCEKVVFDKCKFYDNGGSLFNCLTEIRVKNSELTHHRGTDLSNVNTYNCELHLDDSEGGEY